MTIELTDAEAKDLLAVCDAACRACGLDAALVAAPIYTKLLELRLARRDDPLSPAGAGALAEEAVVQALAVYRAAVAAVVPT